MCLPSILAQSGTSFDDLGVAIFLKISAEERQAGPLHITGKDQGLIYEQIQAIVTSSNPMYLTLPGLAYWVTHPLSL